MMNWRAIGAASVIAMIATFSNPGSTQDIRSQQAALEKDIAALNIQLDAKQQQITALRNKPSPEQADVASAQKTLDAARVELKASPGPDSEGKVRNAEFKLKLAQLKFDKANDGIEALNDDIDKLKQQVGIKQQQIKELNSQTADQAQAQKLADDRLKRQEQELARTKQEAESAQKEIERLKAALAAQEAAVVKTTAVKDASAASALTAAESTSKAVESAAKPAVAAPAEVPKAAAPTATTTTATPSANSNGLIKLNSQDQVLHELQATASLIAQATRGEDDASLVLYLKHPGTQATNHDKISLRALGNKQYRSTTKVEAGEYEAVIGFNRWPVQFSADEAGDTTFLCDYRNKDAPRLVIYQKALEGASK